MFAKLFTTPHGQLLVTKEFDDDDEAAFKVTARGEDVDGITAAMSADFETKEERDEAFDSVGQDEAETTARSLHGMLASLTTPTTGGDHVG